MEDEKKRVVWLQSAQCQQPVVQADDTNLLGLAFQAMRLPNTLSKSQIEMLGFALLTLRFPSMTNGAEKARCLTDD